MEDGASLFSPDFLRPSQWRDLHRSANGDAAPIGRLLLALLEISLRDAISSRCEAKVRRRRTRSPRIRPRADALRSSRARERATEACAWMFVTGDSGPFAFVNVCETLGIDAERLRARVRERLAERQAAARRDAAGFRSQAVVPCSVDRYGLGKILPEKS